MKKNPGKVLWPLMLLAASLLYAAPATYHLDSDKTEAFIKQPVTITFTATQTDHTNVMYFFLEPEQSDKYTITLLRKVIADHAYHSNTTTFQYVLFPLKAGSINVRFHFTVKTASDRSVAQAYVEDHDDSKSIQMESQEIPLAPLTLNVKTIEKPVDLVGDFRLAYHIENKKIHAYESADLSYTLTGTGYKIGIEKPLPAIKGVKQFSDIDTQEMKLTTKGYRQQKTYRYALSADRNFTVPSVSITAFSPSTKHYYTLVAPEANITVQPLDPQQLLDKQSAPAPTPFDWTRVLRGLGYMFVFLLGFLTARLLPKNLKRWKKETRFDDLRKAKDPKTLMTLLISRYRNDVTEPFIARLEAQTYKNAKERFKTLKEELLQALEATD